MEQGTVDSGQDTAKRVEGKKSRVGHFHNKEAKDTKFNPRDFVLNCLSWIGLVLSCPLF
jgi:hypothetical protein